MTGEQALEILETIEAYYPNFMLGSPSVVEKRVLIWSKELMKMDYNKVKRNLDEYKNKSIYPPTIADIRPRVQANYSMKKQLEEIYGDMYD